MLKVYSSIHSLVPRIIILLEKLEIIIEFYINQKI